MEQEIWKVIESHPMYEVSNLGKVRKISSGKLLKQCLDSKGYPSVNVNDGKKATRKVVHRFVAKAFIPNPENKPCIDHIDTIRTDDMASNLRWVTHKENMNNTLTLKKRLETLCRKNKINPIYVYDTSKSKNGRCVMEFCTIRTAAKHFCVSYGKIKNAIDNPNKRINGYLLKSERKRYLTKQ